MELIKKALEVWKKIETPVTGSFNRTIVAVNECFGSNNNCVSCTVKQIVVLDSNMNKLHILKIIKNQICNIELLITPQPLNKYESIEVGINRNLILLIGKNDVGLIHLDQNSKINQTCKKSKAIFNSNEKVIGVKWYPELEYYFAILTRFSFHIFQYIDSDNIQNIFEYSLLDLNQSQSSSFGLKDELVDFDFGTGQHASKNSCIYVLLDNGNVMKIPDITEFKKSDGSMDVKIILEEQIIEDYSREYSSINVLRSNELDIISRCTSDGSLLQNSILLNDILFNYENINLKPSKVSDFKCKLLSDEISYVPRAWLIHNEGIFSLTMPWVDKIRSFLYGNEKYSIESIKSSFGKTITNLDIFTSSAANSHGYYVCGFIIQKESLQPTEISVFLHPNKRLAQCKMQPEYLNVNDSSLDKKSFQPSSSPSNSSFKNYFLEEVRKCLREKSGRFPLVSRNTNENNSDDISTLLEVSENISSIYLEKMEIAGKIFDNRFKQIKNVAKLQIEQLHLIQNEAELMKCRAKTLAERYRGVASRQDCLIKQISNISKITNSKNIPPEDKKAITTIKLMRQRLDNLNAVIRSCKVRLNQIETIDKEITDKNKSNTAITKVDNDTKDKFKQLLEDESLDIKNLVNDVKNLMSYK